MRSGLSCVLALSLTGLTACSSSASELTRSAPAVATTPDDFTHHFRNVDGGRIDWTDGYILAEGIGYPNGRESSEAQAKSMATRAAEIVAARNALAMAHGIHLDASRRVADLADGRVRIEGVVRGHRVVRRHWDPNADPPTARVVMEVPLWGARGVATIFARSARGRAYQTAGGRRVALSSVVVDVSDVMIVIDARGKKVSPCLFPVVVDADGRTLYDIGTPLPEVVSDGPAVRYVETRLSFEQLHAAVDSRFEPLWFDILAQDRPGVIDMKRVPSTSPARESAPDTQPSRRRTKQRIVVKTIDPAGGPNPRLTITREDAERLRNSPEASSAMRKAQVLVVVDASAAGSEGRGPFESDTVVALLSAVPARP